MRLFALDETRLDILEKKPKILKATGKVNCILFLSLTVQNPGIFGKIKSNIFTTFGKVLPSGYTEEYSPWVQSNNLRLSVIYEIYRSHKMKENY